MDPNLEAARQAMVRIALEQGMLAQLPDSALTPALRAQREAEAAAARAAAVQAMAQQKAIEYVAAQRSYTVDAWVAAAQAASRSTSKQLEEIARVITAGIASADFLAVHQTVGALAQKSVLASFDQTVGRANNSGAHGYRTSGKLQRYSGERLRAAIADPSFFEATEHGLNFINTTLLDERAKQWARINFGAGDRGKGSHAAFGIRFSNMVVTTLSLDIGARPAFLIPPGYFLDAAGNVAAPTGPTPGSSFYVAGTGPFAKKKYIVNAEGERIRKPMTARKVTKGIHARNFFTPGLARIAKEIPPRYQDVLSKLYDDGRSAVRPVPVTVRPVVYRRESRPRTAY